MPPVRPMLAKSVKGIPDPAKFDGGLSFEPKWDGFRCLVFKDGDEVELTSRNTKPLTRYFPEVVAAAREQLPDRCVLDGELFVRRSGRGSSSRCSRSASTRRRRGSRCSRRRPRPASWPSTLLALGDESLVDAAVLDAPRAARGGARRAHRPDLPDPHDHRRQPRPRAGSSSSRARGWTAWSPSRWGRRTSRTPARC